MLYLPFFLLIIYITAITDALFESLWSQIERENRYVIAKREHEKWYNEYWAPHNKFCREIDSSMVHNMWVYPSLGWGCPMWKDTCMNQNITFTSCFKKKYRRDYISSYPKLVCEQRQNYTSECVDDFVQDRISWINMMWEDEGRRQWCEDYINGREGINCVFFQLFLFG